MVPKTTAAMNLYGVHPSVNYARAVVENMAAKTGRDIDTWARLVKSDGPDDTRARKAWLKTEHGIGMTTAAMIINHAEGRGAEDIDPKAYLRSAPGMVDAMYDGPKAALRPLHDELVMRGRRLGDDVRICPCSTIVPFYREHVFAQIKPTTRTRIDLGLALKGAKGTIPKRILDTSGLAKGDRITHRIPIETATDIDDFVDRWLKIAYDLDSQK